MKNAYRVKDSTGVEHKVSAFAFEVQGALVMFTNSDGEVVAFFDKPVHVIQESAQV